MYFLLNLSLCVKSYWHFCQSLPCPRKFRKFLFCLNSSFNIRKSHKISSGKALYFRSTVISQKPHGRGGVENTPRSAFRVKGLTNFQESALSGTFWMQVHTGKVLLTIQEGIIFQCHSNDFSGLKNDTLNYGHNSHVQD